MPLLRWDAPGPYVVAFSTRLGGVSREPFESLNLGRLTEDSSELVTENRRRLCAQLGVGYGELVFNRQVHGADVRVANPASSGVPGDGLVTTAPRWPLLVFTADCCPVALVLANGTRPAVALLHVGWRGLLAGIAEAGVASLANGCHAVIGPGIGPCCYEVGEEVAERFRVRFGARVVRRGRLDLWAAIERALLAGGAAQVARTDLCTACHPGLLFSHRRDGPRTGRQGAVAFVT
ncbi:MAG: laccase domain-containing protein [Candidatus Rokuibacteriota bacterium]|nr:MAG: laccase domain-containing protein [Candidatus Rokubacteria bacterium]